MNNWRINLSDIDIVKTYTIYKTKNSFKAYDNTEDYSIFTDINNNGSANGVYVSWHYDENKYRFSYSTKHSFNADRFILIEMTDDMINMLKKKNEFIMLMMEGFKYI